jgi:trigger factor
MPIIYERLFVNVTVENLAPCKKLLRVEVELAKVQEIQGEITRDFQREARLPGFRPGKAPIEMVAKRFEKEIAEEGKRKLISDSYRKAVSEQKLEVVNASDVEEVQFAKDQPAIFTVTVETAPEFTLPEYKGLPAKREKASVTDADVARGLEVLRQQRAEYPTATRDLAANDIAVINYTGTVDGKPLTDLAPAARGLTEKTGFWILVSPDSFIPGFAPQLIGMKAGEKRTVNVDFPADFVTPQLAGKKGVYEVELSEVKTTQLPELNDEFAKSYGAENLEKLREGVRADLQNELNTKQSRELRNQVIEELLKQIQCDLPESLVQQETRRVVYNIVNENQRRGVPKEAMDAQKEQIYSSASNTAKERIKASFAFNRIAQKEGIRVDQMTIAARLQAMATQNKMPVEKLMKELEKRNALEDIYQDLVSEKVIDLLAQFAKIEEITIAPQS